MVAYSSRKASRKNVSGGIGLITGLVNSQPGNINISGDLVIGFRPGPTPEDLGENSEYVVEMILGEVPYQINRRRRRRVLERASQVNFQSVKRRVNRSLLGAEILSGRDFGSFTPSDRPLFQAAREAATATNRPDRLPSDFRIDDEVLDRLNRRTEVTLDMGQAPSETPAEANLEELFPESDSGTVILERVSEIVSQLGQVRQMSYGGGFMYTPPTVPDIGNVKETLSNITIPLYVTVYPETDNPLIRPFEQENAELPPPLDYQDTIVFDIPLDSIFEIRSLDDLPCSEILNASSAVDRARNFLDDRGARLRTMRSDVSNLQELANNVLSGEAQADLPGFSDLGNRFNLGGGGNGGEDIPSDLGGLVQRVRNVNPRDIRQNLSSGQVSDFRDRLDNINLDRVDVDSTLNEAQDLAEQIRNQIPDRCGGDLLDRLSELIDIGERLQNIIDKARDLLERLRELLTLDLPSCAEISNQFSQLQSEVDNFIQNELPNDVRNALPNSLISGNRVPDPDEISFRTSEIGGTEIIAVASVTIEGETYSVSGAVEAPEGTIAAETRQEAREFAQQTRAKVENARERISQRLDNLLQQARDFDTQAGRLNIDQPCQGLENLRARIDGLVGALELAEPGEVDIERPDIELSCEEVASGLQRRISSYNREVSRFTRVPMAQRTLSDRRRLVSRGQGLLSEIDREITREPCKRQFRARIRSALSNLEGIRTRLPSQIPCSEKFPEIEGEIDVFVKNSSGTRLLDRPKLIQRQSQRGSELINRIQEQTEPGDPCREQFATRVRNALDRLETATSDVRILEAPENFQEEQQQQIEDLRESIDLILTRSRLGIGDGGLDIGDGGANFI